jgi:hypothetical protein
MRSLLVSDVPLCLVASDVYICMGYVFCSTKEQMIFFFICQAVIVLSRQAQMHFFGTVHLIKIAGILF